MFNWRVIISVLIAPSMLWAVTKYLDADGIKNPAHTKTWMMPPSPGTLMITTDNAATATNLAGVAANGKFYAGPVGPSPSAAPTFRSIVAGDLPDTYQSATTLQASGKVYAGPVDPSPSAAPTFRSLVAGDLPDTYQSATTLRSNGTFLAGPVAPSPSAAPTYRAIVAGDLPGTLTPDIVQFSSQTTPVSPAPSVFKTYFKSDGNLYKLNNAGTENRIGGGALIVTGNRASPMPIAAPSGILYVASSGERQAWFIEGSGGAVDITANPQIAAGTTVGQELVLVCRNDSNPITFDDGTGLSLNGQFICGTDSVLNLFWDSSVWVETSRRN